jgi:exonuclease SbcD
VRFLHTSDWHLGRTIRGQSRQPEFESVLDDVVRVAIDEGVDAVLIAGDTFDSFAPPADAEKLLYETLSRIVRERIAVVMVAGNHDSAPRFDALSNVLHLANIYCAGSPPSDEAYAPLRIPSRDGTQITSIAAIPWIPERSALDFERLSGASGDVHQQYADRVTAALRFYANALDPNAITLLVGHVLISGAEIAQGGGERKLHIGDAFAVEAQNLPQNPQYIALGHVHRRQEIIHAVPTHYCGSLLQLDFGEGGQEKFVNIIDIAGPGLPANIKPVAITSGRTLRTLRITLDELTAHAGKYGEEYLRVIVQVDQPVLSLYEQVREMLPNALDVTAERIDEPATGVSVERRNGLAPDELLARYYRERHDAEIDPGVIALFNELYRAEETHASA